MRGNSKRPPFRSFPSLIIEPCLEFRASDFEFSRMVRRSELHPRHATEKPRCRQPGAFRKSMFFHGQLRINRAGRMESTGHKIFPPGLEEQAIAFDDHLIIKNNGDLPAGRPHPIAQRGDNQHHCGDAQPDAAFLYGWPQCGQVARPSRRFFWQCGHGTRLPFGRVTIWMIRPSHHVNGIQASTVTN